MESEAISGSVGHSPTGMVAGGAWGIGEWEKERVRETEMMGGRGFCKSFTTGTG